MSHWLDPFVLTQQCPFWEKSSGWFAIASIITYRDWSWKLVLSDTVIVYPQHRFFLDSYTGFNTKIVYTCWMIWGEPHFRNPPHRNNWIPVRPSLPFLLQSTIRPATSAQSSGVSTTSATGPAVACRKWMMWGVGVPPKIRTPRKGVQ